MANKKVKFRDIGHGQMFDCLLGFFLWLIRLVTLFTTICYPTYKSTDIFQSSHVIIVMKCPNFVVQLSFLASFIQKR